MTTSFGSICFGSFLVAIVQALRALANSARDNGDAQIFACIAECILACLASILEYFNKVRTVYNFVFVFLEVVRRSKFVRCCMKTVLVGVHLCRIVRYVLLEGREECI